MIPLFPFVRGQVLGCVEISDTSDASAMKLTLTGFAVAACIALLAPGCGDNSADTDADASKPAAQMPQMTAEERSAALRTYAKLCATCHGKDMSGGSSKSLIDGV